MERWWWMNRWLDDFTEIYEPSWRNLRVSRELERHLRTRETLENSRDAWDTWNAWEWLDGLLPLLDHSKLESILVYITLGGLRFLENLVSGSRGADLISHSGDSGEKMLERPAWYLKLPMDLSWCSTLQLDLLFLWSLGEVMGHSRAVRESCEWLKRGCTMQCKSLGVLARTLERLETIYLWCLRGDTKWWWAKCLRWWLQAMAIEMLPNNDVWDASWWWMMVKAWSVEISSSQMDYILPKGAWEGGCLRSLRFLSTALDGFWSQTDDVLKSLLLICTSLQHAFSDVTTPGAMATSLLTLTLSPVSPYHSSGNPIFTGSMWTNYGCTTHNYTLLWI